MALALAGEMRAEVPSATLAGEALAVARATVPAPRRLGATSMPDGLGVAAAFAFVLAHLTDVVLHFAPAAAEDVSGPEPVHQMRVALRRLRSAVAVFRRMLDCPELQAANAGLKALSAQLGPTRDWDVFLGETAPAVSAVFPNEPKLARLIAAAERRRRECHAALREFLGSAEFRRLGLPCPGWPARAPGIQRSRRAPINPCRSGTSRRRAGPAAAQDGPHGRPGRPGGGGVAPVAPEGQANALCGGDFCAPLYSGKAPRRFIHRLAQLQDALGQLNERPATAEKLLAELGGSAGRHAYAAGLVLGCADLRDATEVLPRVLRRLGEVPAHGGVLGVKRRNLCLLRGREPAASFDAEESRREAARVIESLPAPMRAGRQQGARPEASR